MRLLPEQNDQVPLGALNRPIRDIGLGEQAEDLQPFSLENGVKAIFGLEG